MLFNSLNIILFFVSFCDIFLEESVGSQATIGAKISNDLSTSQPLDSQELIFPNGTDHANVASLNSQAHTNLYEDIMAELNSNNDIFPPMKRPRTFSPVEEDNDLINLFEKQISTEALIEVENELQKALNVTSKNTLDGQTSNVDLTACSSKVVNFTPFEVQAPVSNTGEGSSTGLFSENTLQSWYNPHVITTNSSTLDSSSQFQASLSNGNFASQMQLQPYSSSTTQFPMFPSFDRESIGNFPTQPTGQRFQAYNQYPGNNMIPFNLSPPLGTNYWIHSAQSMSPSYPNSNSNSNLLNVFSPLDDLQDYIHTWEVSKLFSFFLTEKPFIILLTNSDSPHFRGC